jgi:hypothetical protein
MSKTSAIARANNEVVYSKVYINYDKDKKYPYHSLLTSLFAICSFNVKNQDASFWVLSHPNTLSGLASALRGIHYFKLSIK